MSERWLRFVMDEYVFARRRNECSKKTRGLESGDLVRSSVSDPTIWKRLAGSIPPMPAMPKRLVRRSRSYRADNNLSVRRSDGATINFVILETSRRVSPQHQSFMPMECQRRIPPSE